jgi:hypothetical protein
MCEIRNMGLGEQLAQHGSDLRRNHACRNSGRGGCVPVMAGIFRFV